jgi:opacity protein-like surface antigen
MKRIFIVMSVLTLLLSASTMAVTKVKSTDHSGFYVGFGLGYANQGLDFKNTGWELDREDGGAVLFFIGGALKPNLLLGLDANAWTRKDNNITRTISTSTACLTYYVSPKFFVKGGIGWANANVEFEVQHGRYNYTKSGFGMMVGTGMEFRLLRRFALVPSAQWSYQGFDEFKANTFSLTLGFGWYW